MEAFFLPATDGSRFCVFHPALGETRGNILFAPPFAEEMNKSRRMVALQARAFAQMGYSVLLIDLIGTGDSSGDFGDATWEAWRADLTMGATWLHARQNAPLYLWGLRLGGLLAMDSLAHGDIAARGILLWQPVLSGESFLTQFLRLRLAGDMLSGNASSGGVQALRAELNRGSRLEIAGYEISSALAQAINALQPKTLGPANIPVTWLEIVADAGRALPPAVQSVADNWRAASVTLNMKAVPCEPFWTTQEIAECPTLIAPGTHAWPA